MFTSNLLEKAKNIRTSAVSKSKFAIANMAIRGDVISALETLHALAQCPHIRATGKQGFTHLNIDAIRTAQLTTFINEVEELVSIIGESKLLTNKVCDMLPPALITEMVEMWDATEAAYNEAADKVAETVTDEGVTKTTSTKVKDIAASAVNPKSAKTSKAKVAEPSKTHIESPLKGTSAKSKPKSKPSKTHIESPLKGEDTIPVFRTDEEAIEILEQAALEILSVDGLAVKKKPKNFEKNMRLYARTLVTADKDEVADVVRMFKNMISLTIKK